jgi:hypothetical protein
MGIISRIRSGRRSFLARWESSIQIQACLSCASTTRVKLAELEAISGREPKREKQLDDRHGASAKAAALLPTSTTANAPNHRDCPDVRQNSAGSYKASATCRSSSIARLPPPASASVARRWSTPALDHRRSSCRSTALFATRYSLPTLSLSASYSFPAQHDVVLLRHTRGAQAHGRPRLAEEQGDL